MEINDTITRLRDVAFDDGDINTYSGEAQVLYRKLRDISLLQQGWDGFNAVPVNKQVIDNMLVVLNHCDGGQLKGWCIFPEVNGTILLQNYPRRAGINIGDNSFSYFCMNGNQVSGDDNKPFSASVFINILNKING